MSDFETAPRGTICEKDVQIDLLTRQRDLMMELLHFTPDDLDRSLDIWESAKAVEQ